VADDREAVDLLDRVLQRQVGRPRETVIIYTIPKGGLLELLRHVLSAVSARTPQSCTPK
jgi:hypothetical protein